MVSSAFGSNYLTSPTTPNFRLHRFCFSSMKIGITESQFDFEVFAAFLAEKNNEKNSSRPISSMIQNTDFQRVLVETDLTPFIKVEENPKGIGLFLCRDEQIG